MAIRGENNPRQIAISEWSKNERAQRDAEIAKSRARQNADAAERAQLNAALQLATRQRQLAELKQEFEPPPPAPAAAPVTAHEPQKLTPLAMTPKRHEECKRIFHRYHATKQGGYARGMIVLEYAAARGYASSASTCTDEAANRAFKELHDDDFFLAFDREGELSALRSAAQYVSSEGQ